VKNFGDSLPCSQVTATAPYSEPHASSPQLPTLRIIPVLSSRLRLGLPGGVFLSGFPNKILYAFLISPIRVTCPNNLILLDLITPKVFSEVYQL